MKNKEVSEMLLKIVNLLELEGETIFRIRAYEKAAKAVESLAEPIEDTAKRDALKEIPGVGESIAEKIKEYLDTGRLKYLDAMEDKYPSGLIDIMNVQGIGPKKALGLYKKLKIKNIGELKEAAQDDKLKGLPGFGEKTQENILKGISLREKSNERMLLNEASALADSIIKQLKKHREIKQIAPAGSLRRQKETIGDIDILCTVDKGKEKLVIDKFIKLEEVQRVLSSGGTKGSVVTKEGVQVDLRVLEPSSYGAAMQYFTGSKEHNVVLREFAKEKGLTINEYGVFKIGRKSRPVASETEEDVYRVLGLEYIPPEIRENRGEIEAAKAGNIPKLIELKDIKGDIHVHSNYSDGVDTIEQIGNKGMELGYEWVIVCDHSQSLHVAQGLSIEKLKLKRREIDQFNQKGNKIKLLYGTEADILAGGAIDYPEEILKEFDFVIASIHTGFKQTEKQIMERIIKGLSNKYVHCLAHPTGRLLNKREPYQVNLEKVIETAKENKKLLEINAHADRLDLNDVYSKRAKELGVKIAIGTDSHNKAHMSYMSLGVSVARRGWLEKKDVINTLSYQELKKLLAGF